MASVVAGGLFNAVAFVRAGFLFSHLNKNGYEAEAKRHNKALEQLVKEKEACYEHTVEKSNRIKELRQQLSDTNSDVDDTNHALDLLRKVRQEERRRFRYTVNGKGHYGEPQLSAYCTTIPEMKKYEYIFIGGMAIGIGDLVHKLA